MLRMTQMNTDKQAHSYLRRSVPAAASVAIVRNVSGSAGCGGSTFRRRAFTLLEILLVIVLVIAIFGLAWPSMDGAARAEELPESARRMKALVAMCRAEAMNEARRYRVYFAQDGSVHLRVQRDPIAAPEEFIEVSRSWAREAFLLEKVWVEAIQLLPDGLAPVIVDDDVMEFTQLDGAPQSVQGLERPAELNFDPNGGCGSMRWVLRDASGRGMLMTLDGRLGRVQVEGVETVKAAETSRPPKLKDDQAEMLTLGAKKS